MERIFLLKPGKDLYWKTIGAENLQVFPARIICRYKQKEIEILKEKVAELRQKINNKFK
ncbi:MAG: hypothetical protein WB014_03090 [Methanosarcina sp.]